jgi:pyocin large subunit-like protein
MAAHNRDMNLRSTRWPLRRLLTAGLALFALFAYWQHTTERGQRQTVPEIGSSAAEARAPGAAKAWGNSVGFANSERLEEHYQKHGAEFGNITRQDYLHQAQLLRDVAVGGPVIEAVRRDGVFTRFDRQTGAFIAVNPNGVIRTFFKPNDGERYFRRQSERD